MPTSHASTLRIATACITTIVATACSATRFPAPAQSQRPKISSNTSTTKFQTFELESGVAWDPGDTFATPTTIKYGSDEATEIFLGWSPLQWADLPGGDGIGIGDVTIGSRHRLIEEEIGVHPSFAVQLTGKLPAANPNDGLGTGEVDFFIAGIGTQSFAGFTATAFYQLGVTGRPMQDTDLEHRLALVAETPINDRWSGFGELAGIFAVEGDRSPTFLTLGLLHAVRPELVVDIALQIGLNDDAGDLAILFGFDRNFGGVGIAPPL